MMATIDGDRAGYARAAGHHRLELSMLGLQQILKILLQAA
jgi:hypothetical protein